MEHSVKINVSDGDMDRLFRLVGQHGLTVGELFENVICDLVGDGNGSDEREMMNRWFERCWFSFEPEETLLKYCLDRSYDVRFDVYTIVSAYDDNEYYKESPEELDEDDVDENGKPWFQYDLETLEEYREKYPDQDIEEQIAICRKWLEEKDNF